MRSLQHNPPGRLSHCSNCRGTEYGMSKVDGRWICDPCNRFEKEADDLDIEGYEERRRQRLAEAQEY